MKELLHLLDKQAIWRLVKVLVYGARKYGVQSWRVNETSTENIASIKRHIAKVEEGEHVDSESGLNHADHVFCRAMFMSVFEDIEVRGTEKKKGG